MRGLPCIIENAAEPQANEDRSFYMV